MMMIHWWLVSLDGELAQLEMLQGLGSFQSLSPQFGSSSRECRSLQYFTVDVGSNQTFWHQTISAPRLLGTKTFLPYMFRL